MKCPKCSYLGFETGDRCKNCGYDFSLMVDPAEPRDFDLALRSAEDPLPAPVQWDDTFDGEWISPPSPGTPDPRPPAPMLTPMLKTPMLRTPVPSAARAGPTDRKMAPFTPAFDMGDDEPLIRVPATPRPPLAVRRTPETPRLRAVPKPSRAISAAPVLEFEEERPAAPIAESMAEVRARTAARLAPPLPQAAHAEVCGAGPRLAAVALDHVLLSAIDLTVIFLTLRLAGLAMADWAALPPVPLVAFLLLIKLAYFCACTAVGGQTIGKMAARIRVVTMEDTPVDGVRAVKRALAGAVSAALFGLGYLPALIGPDRRALHDRVTRTRVIALPSV